MVSNVCWVNILVERQGVMGRLGREMWKGMWMGGKWEGWGMGSEGKPIRATEEC